MTELVHPGENRLEFHVYYQGLINRVWNSGDLRMGMICDVLADGQCIAVGACHPAQVVHRFVCQIGEMASAGVCYAAQEVEVWQALLHPPQLPD